MVNLTRTWRTASAALLVAAAVGACGAAANRTAAVSQRPPARTTPSPARACREHACLSASTEGHVVAPTRTHNCAGASVRGLRCLGGVGSARRRRRRRFAAHASPNLASGTGDRVWEDAEDAVRHRRHLRRGALGGEACRYRLPQRPPVQHSHRQRLRAARRPIWPNPGTADRGDLQGTPDRHRGVVADLSAEHPVTGRRPRSPFAPQADGARSAPDGRQVARPLGGPCGVPHGAHIEAGPESAVRRSAHRSSAIGRGGQL